MIELQFYLSPFARRTLQLIADQAELCLFVDLLADAVKHADYQAYSKILRTSNREFNRRRVVKIRANLSILRAINRLRRRGHNLSWIMEESIFLAFKKGYIKER